MNKNNMEEMKNRVGELENLMDSYVRTERHLEQHSDIASKNQIHHAHEIQKERSEQIENLENKIAYGNNSGNNELENAKANYEKTEKYISYNGDHMSTAQLNNIKEKQKNRKNLINYLE
ncbi:hypothetical protein [Clostridium sp. UBA4548]|uniref:hypothetical protein n=1 Tax=Clostridium sp. UBA4548 TaxID=1946361 RepID=UPI0025C68A0D|nr:hypothetical protein [Clostridium sp. UBA4548]